MHGHWHFRLCYGGEPLEVAHFHRFGWMLTGFCRTITSQGNCQWRLETWQNSFFWTSPIIRLKDPSPPRLPTWKASTTCKQPWFFKKIKELSKFLVEHPQKKRKNYRACLFSDEWNLMQKCFLGCMWLLGMAVDWFNEDNSNWITSLVPSQRFFPPFPH